MRKTNFLSIEKSAWLDYTAANLPNGETIIINDIDNLIRSRPSAGNKTCIMCLEIKCKSSNQDIKRSQRLTIGLIHESMKLLNGKTIVVDGITMEVDYQGFNLLQFSNTSPTNSEYIWWNHKEITEVQLLDYLSFGCCSYCF